jgi:tetratricopeptide (TPR) repeat protein
MGSAFSEAEEIPAQIFRSANTSKRRMWLKSTDVLDVRVSTSVVEETFAKLYYDTYFTECARKRDAADFFPNEDFQMAVDTLEENPAAHAADLQGVAQKYLHDITDFVTNIVDDVAAETYRPVRVAPGVGRAYVEKGFFFFVWDSYVGEKFGRLELRNCRRVMELQSMSVHVPLTYHIVYKGRGTTVQSLVPVNHSTRIRESDSAELHCLAQELSCAFCLGPYEEDRVAYFLPSQIQAHVGKDARMYFLQNSYWSPPWLSSKGERSGPEQRFSCVRAELLIRKGNPICCRAFQKDALATENAYGVKTMRRLLDHTLHEVPSILGTVQDMSPDSVVVRFRRLGFNFSMLGMLLLSLFRNVSPPERAVRAVLSEMYIRGIRQYIMWKTQPAVRAAMATTPTAAASAGGAAGGKSQAMQGMMMAERDETGDDYEGFISGMDSVGSRSFIDEVMIVLRAFLEYQGAPQPRAATLLTRAIPAPLDIFGGEVIPHIYKKFRLLPMDVDLYGKIDDEQKLEIYKRVCKSLGVRIENGVISRVLPIVLQPGVPRTFLPEWVLRHTDVLVQRLLRKQASRSDWLKFGPALIPLLRLQPQNLAFYPQLEKVLVTLQQHPTLTYHVLQHCFSLAALNIVIHHREQQIESITDRQILIQLYRKRAFAYSENGRITEAAEEMRLALAQAEYVLEACGNHFSQQFRRLTSEYAYYVNSSDLHIEMNMLRLLSRYCEPDVLIADDFLQLAVTRKRMLTNSAVDEMELEWDLSRAIRLYAQTLGEKHPKAIRAMANLAIVWYETNREEDAKVVIQSLVKECGDACPADVRDIASRMNPRQLNDKDGTNEGKWNASNVLLIPNEHELQRWEPLMFILHVPRFGV